jgi:hypothetical protein
LLVARVRSVIINLIISNLIHLNSDQKFLFLIYTQLTHAK